jgi:DNA-binding CsgD family transcriptional regulator
MTFVTAVGDDPQGVSPPAASLALDLLAGTLNLSEGTMRNDLSEAISKMGAQNRVEAARIARERGWL